MNRIIRQLAAMALLLAPFVTLTTFASEPAKENWTVVGAGKLGLAVLRGEAPLFQFGTVLYGAKWTNPRRDLWEKAQPKVEGGKTRVFELDKAFFFANWGDKDPMPGAFRLRYEASPAGTNSVRIAFTLTPDTDFSFGSPKPTPSCAIGPMLLPSNYFQGGKAVMELADGQTKESPLPPTQGGADDVKAVTFITKTGEKTRLTFDPPAQIHLDHNEFRCYARKDVKAGEPFTANFLLELPGATTFEPGNRLADMSNWFPLNFQQAEDFASPSEIGLQNWPSKPAGKHGFAQVKGKDLVFEDGTPAKFWGVNHSWWDVCPPEPAATTWADKWSKHGVNLVRMHKFIGHGRGLSDQKIDTQLLVEEQAKRWDHFNALLKERGIYTGWSTFYSLALSPADKDRIWGYDEIMAQTKLGPPWYHRATIGLVNFAPDLQDLHIAIVKKLLNRVNTVTGKRYADDPMLAYIEIQNEDDIFFGYKSLVDSCPTYKKYIDAEFAKWLKMKYGGRDTLAKEWGKQLAAKEDVETSVAAFDGGPDDSRRGQDRYAFLYECQDKYYKRVAAAIRETGYKGALVGSCWQAQTFLGHLYNVRSDREIGIIDRHNYGSVNLLQNPGSGLLSAGMQQVGDRPFSLTEWAGGALYGGMESVPVIGFIGMGVQGWDLSAHFSSMDPGVTKNMGDLNRTCDRFMSLVQYPSIARALYRGDLTESKPVTRRVVSIPGMAKNQIGFSENFSLLGDANIKEFSAVVPKKTLAIGPVMLDFVDGPVAEPVEKNYAPYLDENACTLRSASGQVFWDWSKSGYFTVNTPGTKALIGFGEGKKHVLGEVSIQSRNPLSFIYLTAKDPGETSATAKKLLITTVGRMQFQGVALDEIEMKPLGDVPKDAPLLIEPVTATVELKGRGACKVFALDHGGRKTMPLVEVPVHSGQFVLDGAKYCTPYYLVEFAQ